MGTGLEGGNMQIPRTPATPMSPVSDQPLVQGSRTAQLTAYPENASNPWQEMAGKVTQEKLKAFRKDEIWETLPQSIRTRAKKEIMEMGIAKMLQHA